MSFLDNKLDVSKFYGTTVST